MSERAGPWKRREVIGDATLYLGDCLEILPGLGGVDHVVSDPPYSARTHAGHDASQGGHKGSGNDGANRKPLGYRAWDAEDVARFASATASACDGWILWMADHRLVCPIQDALEGEGRYIFAPIPYFAPGSRTRLSGDGPACWTIWIVPSRIRGAPLSGTLPGGYVRQPGWDVPEKMGGKPVRLMASLISDYTRPGDNVCDPCMGSASTGVAALNLGRRFIGIDCDAQEFDIACERIAAAQAQGRLFEPEERKPEQIDPFGSVT